MKTLLRNVIGLFVLGIILLVVTMSSGTLKQKSLPFGLTTYISGSDTVVDNLKKDAVWQVEHVKKKGMDITVKDVIDSLARIKKIREDVSLMKDYMYTTVTNFFTK